MTPQDIKLLWGRSGGRCSLCKCPLSHESATQDHVFHIGAQAHIVAKSSGGPRGTVALSQIERRAYSNHILLCPTDHAFVDASPEDFPPQRLRDIKEAHENWVRDRLASRPHPERIFLHYLDHYFLEMKDYGGQPQEEREARLATRFALLWSGCIIVPAAAYVESELCRGIIDELRPLFLEGCIWQVGSGASWAEYLDRKLIQYPRGSKRRAAYLAVDATKAPPFLSREHRATDHISSRWLGLDPDRALSEFARRSKHRAPPGIESRWIAVPERLENRAFILDHVAPLLVDSRISRAQENFLHAIINGAYYESFLDEFECGLVHDLVFLHSNLLASSRPHSFSYRRLRFALRRSALLETIEQSQPPELLRLRSDPRWMEARPMAVVGD